MVPSRLSSNSVAGHSGLLTVVSKSWTKFSNSGLKSTSSLRLRHLFKKDVRNVPPTLIAASYLDIMTRSLSALCKVTHSQFWYLTNNRIWPVIISTTITLAIKAIQKLKQYFFFGTILFFLLFYPVQWVACLCSYPYLAICTMFLAEWRRTAPVVTLELSTSGCVGQSLAGMSADYAWNSVCEL